jgi:hypothetical protein
MSKVNITLSIDEDIKERFKISTIKNKVEMSETVQDFMVRYSDLTDKLIKERNERGQ